MLAKNGRSDLCLVSQWIINTMPDLASTLQAPSDLSILVYPFPLLRHHINVEKLPTTTINTHHKKI